MNRKEAKLLISFSDDVAKTVLIGAEYQIFSLLKTVAKEKFGSVNEGDVNGSKVSGYASNSKKDR